MDVPKSVKTLVALGGNLGPVAENFKQALDELAALPDTTVGRVSSHYEFPAVGSNAGGVFRNAACELITELAPPALLRCVR